MSDNGGNGGANFAFFLAGMGIGAVLALLFAPKSGEETREYLAQKAGASRDYVTAKSRDLRRQAEELVERGKDAVTQQKEQLAAAFDAGKQAYQDEKAKQR
ncbi:MAG TPA: YtxH domain-containing protein [Terriglobia bacterium]|nr:YtxH domain-containing protein [Terriglobia bacterium]